MAKLRNIKNYNKQLYLNNQLNKDIFICSNKIMSTNSKRAPRELYKYDIYSFINKPINQIKPELANFYLTCLNGYFISNQNAINAINSILKQDVYTFTCMYITHWVYVVYDCLIKILNNILFCLNH